jgi:hypothetical protein
MRRISATAAAIAAGVAIALGAGAPAAVAKSCPSGYTKATIGGSQKCLHAGEYCSHQYERQYLHYHYTCVRVRGTYRLEDS